MAVVRQRRSGAAGVLAALRTNTSLLPSPPRGAMTCVRARKIKRDAVLERTASGRETERGIKLEPPDGTRRPDVLTRKKTKQWERRMAGVGKGDCDY